MRARLLGGRVASDFRDRTRRVAAHLLGLVRVIVMLSDKIRDEVLLVYLNQLKVTCEGFDFRTIHDPETNERCWGSIAGEFRFKRKTSWSNDLPTTWG